MFKETTKTRSGSMGGGGGAAAGAGRGGRGAGGGGAAPAGPLTEADKQAIRAAWDQFMKPYLRG
jgi:hypothetical protein